jgi:hypothetical protein
MQGRSRWNIRVPNRCQAAVVPAGLLVACNSVACLAEMGKKPTVSYTNHRASSRHAWGLDSNQLQFNPTGMTAVNPIKTNDACKDRARSTTVSLIELMTSAPS